MKSKTSRNLMNVLEIAIDTVTVICEVIDKIEDFNEREQQIAAKPKPIKQVEEGE